MSPKKTLLLLVILAVTFHEGSSVVDCYECQAPIGKNVACDNKVETTQPKRCPSLCGRFVIKHAGGPDIITRLCAVENLCNVTASENNNEFNKMTECYVCKTDLCNSGQQVFSYFGSILLLFIISKFV